MKMKRCIDCNKYFEGNCTMDVAALDDETCLNKFLVSELHKLTDELQGIEVVAHGCDA